MHEGEPGEVEYVPLGQLAQMYESFSARYPDEPPRETYFPAAQFVQESIDVLPVSAVVCRCCRD